MLFLMLVAATGREQMSSEWWQRAPPVLQSRREVEQTRMAIAKHKARGHDTEGLQQLLAYLERQLAAVEAETRLRKTVQCPTCSSTTDAALERCLWCRQSLAPSDSVMLGGSGVEIGLEAYRKLMEGEKE
jgi:hypothetical protein